MNREESAMGPVAIIGAGIAGLSCAIELQKRGIRSVLFDKGRAPGGRSSTRRVGQLQFDHGAQYFTARDPRFMRTVRTWIEDGLVAEWQGRFAVLRRGVITPKPSDTPRYVGVPSMSAIGRHLASELDVRSGVRCLPPVRVAHQWRLTSDRGENLGSYSTLVVTAPPTQTRELLAQIGTWADRLKEQTSRSCWAVMVALEEPLDTPFDGAFVEDSELSWVARDSSKPGRRAAPECWMLHGSPEWSDAHIEEGAEAVAELLLGSFQQAIGRPLPAPLHLSAHRWRYARSEEPSRDGFLFDADTRIGVAGDWCHGDRISGAYLSGVTLAEQLVNHQGK